MWVHEDYRLSPKQKLQGILVNDDVFQGWSAASQQLILKHTTFRRFLPKQLILQQQQVVDDIYILLSGSMQVGWLQNNGELKISSYFSHSSVFNLVAFLQKKPVNYDYFAIGQVEIGILSGEVFLEQLQQQPQAMWQILNLVSQRMYDLFEQSRYTHTANLTQRIAYYLNKLILQYGQEQDNRCVIELRMTQQEFAESFGISRQTLYKNLQLFLQEKILEWNYSQIHILDVGRLRELLELD